MKKAWKKPELKNLGIENTLTPMPIPWYPENGNWFVCKNCGGDARHDINEIGAEKRADGVYVTPNQTCGTCKISNEWVELPEGTRPVIPSNPVTPEPSMS